jgi:hypothetical protein
MGSDAGKLSASATAGWCASRHMLEIRAIRGDTGVALAVYARETLAVGIYPVKPPARAESIPPAAGLALRWLGPKLVQGFQGDSGSVRLERSGTGQISGTLIARARSVVDTHRVQLRGNFQDLTVRSEPPDCGREASDSNAESGDTGIH